MPSRAATATSGSATRYKAAGLPAIAAIDMRAIPPERGRWLSPVLVEAVGETLGARRAGAAVSQPPRLCAGDALPEMRLQIRMPELLGLAGRAQIPPPARMPPLRHLRADPRDLPELRRGAFAGAVRAGRRAHRRGGRRAVSRGAPRAAVERPHAEHQRSARDLARDRGARGRCHHRHPARGQGPSLPGARSGRRGRRRSRPRAGRPARGRAHLPAAQSGDGARRPRGRLQGAA